VVNHWTDCFDTGKDIDILYLDLQKAFDKVPHKRLVCKLEAYGVTGVILNWIENFCSNCRQRVCVKGLASPWSTVISGAPQGSVLGPILLIYMNDLPDVIKSNQWEFADDTKLYCSITSLTDWTSLQSDLWIGVQLGNHQ